MNKHLTIFGIAVLLICVGLSGCTENIGMEGDTVSLGKSGTTLKDVRVSTRRSYSMDLSNPYEIAYYGCAEEAKRVFHDIQDVSYSDISEIPEYDPNDYLISVEMFPRIEYKNGTATSEVVSKQTYYMVTGYLNALNEFGESQRYSYKYWKKHTAQTYALHNELFNPNNVTIDWDRADLFYPGWYFYIYKDAFSN